MGSLYLISGNEEFSVKEHATELVCRLYGEIPEDNPELEVIRGDDDTEKFTAVLDRFLDTIQTPPFLFPRKSVWMKRPCCAWPKAVRKFGWSAIRSGAPLIRRIWHRCCAI